MSSSHSSSSAPSTTCRSPTSTSACTTTRSRTPKGASYSFSLSSACRSRTHSLRASCRYVRLVKAYHDASAMDAMPEQVTRNPPPSASLSLSQTLGERSS